MNGLDLILSLFKVHTFHTLFNFHLVHTLFYMLMHSCTVVDNTDITVVFLHYFSRTHLFWFAFLQVLHSSKTVRQNSDTLLSSQTHPGYL